MKKKLMILFAALLLLLGACGKDEKAGNAGKEIPKDNAEEKVTFKGFGVKAPAATTDWNDMPFLQGLEDNVNVDIDWTNATAQTYQEQVNLMFASNDLPDLFFSAWTLGANDIVKYGSTGQLIPLEDLIEKEAPNIKGFLDKNPDLKKMITAPDGHIYAIPQYDVSKGSRANDAFFINKAWLDKLGLEVPTTTEEFKEVLKAFKGQDLNGNGKKDEIPFSFMYNNGIRGPHSLSGSFGVVGRNIGVEGGKVFYAPTKPEFKEYVKFMHDLYAEGLIDQEAFTHDVQVYDAKIQNETPILGAYFNWSNFAMFGKADTDYVPVAPLKGPKGDQMWNINAGAFSFSGFSVTSSNKNPARAMKWMDQMYDPEIGLQMTLGPFDQNLKKNDDGTIELIDAPEGVGYEEFRHKFTPGSYGVYGNLQDIRTKLIQSEGAAEKDALADLYGPYQPKEYYPNVMYSAEDAERLSILQTDIDGYIKEMIPKFMIEGKVDESWDAYIDQLKKMGLDELMELHQKYYDNFK
ncbi:extracellular solute-binding protein [Lederbergia wuyishanensis]|uniref:Aldouronate transport system substrate-binding protein n=1 Tax=Lederbergia wuyishanensis TaxID=1347903 RepID=A0ABU0D7L3_9BACI|nr:extracellular solute-binding protein [Lederbergia wuyishanensis]MCJ8009023.1 extracellular solute-binding protein [Lederbergia wuyishanensis]MDQ0344355.1 putative aldouronate transport system substrate-binding protein [Lederbergia wuyishanensis]